MKQVNDIQTAPCRRWIQCFGRLITKIAMIVLFTLICWNLCGLRLITVDCPPELLPQNVYQNFTGNTSLSDAISLIPNLPEGDNAACIRIYGSVYNLTQPLVIFINGNVLLNLTVEGASNLTQHPLLNGAPVDHQGTNARVFHVILGSNNKLTIRNLSFSYNGLNNSIITINQPFGEFEFYNNVVTTYCQAIKTISYNGVNPFKADIHDNYFLRYDIAGQQSANMHTIDLRVVNWVLNSEALHNQINISGNQFFDESSNSILPINILTRNCVITISSNNFYADSMIYNTQSGDEANSISISMIDQSQNASASLELCNNYLENIILYVNAVNSHIIGNKFVVTSTDNPVSGLILLDNQVTPTPTNPYAMTMNAEVKSNQFYNKNVAGNQKPCIRLLDCNNGLTRSIQLSLLGNSLFSYGKALLIERGDLTDEDNIHQVPQFYNNLVSCSTNPVSFYILQGYSSGCTIQIHHSFFENGYPSDSVHFVTDATCGSGDPVISDI
ncbi:MAG: hypothetical protein ACE14O_02095 [Candidatus Cloacimonadaceae bacterium]